MLEGQKKTLLLFEKTFDALSAYIKKSFIAWRGLFELFCLAAIGAYAIANYKIMFCTHRWPRFLVLWGGGTQYIRVFKKVHMLLNNK